MDHQRYKLLERLDAGGMAEVFRGVSESMVGGLKRSVAIKRILPNLAKNKRFIQMFLDEARLAMSLTHTSIVQVFDIGVSDAGNGDQAYFLVMEFIDGCNLKVLLDYLRGQSQRMPVSQALFILMEVCRALSYAHEVNDPETNQPLGIVHRDISPPNILISRRGEVKLADFGLAKAASQLEHTDPGVVKGKFSYLSPEAANAQDIDRRADIFAVGILLYEMLTGKRLFEGETDYKTVLLVRKAEIPSLVAQNPEVTPELEAIVRKALARDAAQRYQRADDLADSMAQYLFSRGLKVTSRDVEQLVVRCLTERQRSQAEVKPPSLIDNMILDEMQKFTSLDDLIEEPLAAAKAEGTTPLNPDQFIDTRNWGGESDLSGPSNRSLRTSLPPVRLTPTPPAGVAPLESMLESGGPKKPAIAPKPPASKIPLALLMAGLFACLVALGYFLLSR